MNFGFTLPWLLASIPAGIAFLVIAYRHSMHGEKRLVPTLFLLRHLTSMPTARRKFVPPLRFFFELLLLILLACAIAGMYFQSTSKNYVFIIDNSLSMASQNWGQTGSKNILAEAVESAKNDLQRLSSATQVKLFETSPRLRALNDSFESPSRVQAILDTIEPRFSADNLELAIGSLGADATIDEINVFSDRMKLPLESSTPSVVPVIFRPLNVGDTSRQNIAISQISISQELSQDSRSNSVLKVGIAAYTREETRVEVTLKGYALSTHAWVPLTSQTLKLKKSDKAEVRFNRLPENFSAFEAELLPQSPEGLNRIDSIAEDNKAYIVMGSSARKMRLVSDYSSKSLGLDTLDIVSFRSIRPSQYQPEEKSTDPVIFHRFVPPQLPQASSLFILPSLSNSLFPVSKPLPQAQVTRWLSSHPVLSYLNLPALELSQLYPLEQVPWMNSLINTTHGIAAMAGERGENRYVVTGFEILPYEGKKSPLLSIFLLNIIKWIADASTQAGYVTTYSPVQVPQDSTSTTYVDSPQELLRAAAAGKAEPEIIPPRPGIMLVRANNQQTFHAVNYFEQTESDLLNLSQVRVTTAARAAEGHRSNVDLLSWLCLIVAGLLGLDLIALLIRGSREIRV